MPDDSRRLIAQRGDWAARRAAFRWPRPYRFNIAEACCDSWARLDPGREAILHLDPDGHRESWSYGKLKHGSDRLANAFRARGLRQGDRVAVLLAQAPEVMLVHFAALKLGAVVLPLFTLFGPEALAYRLADSGARFVVTDPENADKLLALRADLPDLQEIYVTGPVAAPLRAFWEEIASAAAELRPVDTLAEDPAVMIYTSGTTGPPKGVLHAHRFLIGHLPAMECAQEGFPRPGDRGWTPADWAWIGGLMDMAMPCLYYGVPQVSHRMRRFDPEAAFALIRDAGVRNVFLPPTALKLMRQAPVPEGVSLRSISSGGESLGADLLHWAQNRLGVVPNEIYGQTECNLAVVGQAGAMAVRPGAIGQAVPGFEVAVLGPDGRPVAEGALGEISVKRGTPAMFLRYWNQPEKTAEKFNGDWLRTGDLGRSDGGYVTFVSRDDDVITSAGYRIGPTEIENCLAGHPDVVMAAAVGRPDPVRTEIVVAHLVLRDGVALTPALEAELVARVREKISPHVAPRAMVQAASLPMTATGKILRRALRGL